MPESSHKAGPVGENPPVQKNNARPGENSACIWIEDEFSDGKLAADMSRGTTPQRLKPIGPADYPSFGSGDLLLTRHRGDFIKPCPATLNYNCCGLTIFHFGLGCTLGCRYCILSAYLGTEALVLFGNIEEGLVELEHTLSLRAADALSETLPWRYCTGEFTDSLLLDKKSKLASRLIRLFAKYGSATLELKTKTDYVEHLLDLDHLGHTVISFSVNAPEVCDKEEGKAAPLKSRLKAAANAAKAGYPIGLHFDPLIFQPGWEDGYALVLEMIGEHLSEAEVAWVSMGCFRYLPSLKDVMLSRHPETSIYNAEFISGGDGKMRYPRPLRTRMYKYLLKGLRGVLPPAATIYMCMESPRVWLDVFGYEPGTEGLTGLLDKRARELLGTLCK